MASLTIRNLDEEAKRALRIRAAQHGISMEEEARRILKATLAAAAPQPSRLGSHLLGRFKSVADETFALPERRAPRHPPRWDE
jgi:plasmid stability protein